MKKYTAFHHTSPRVSSQLSNKGVVLFPQKENLKIIEPSSPIYDSMEKTWNTKEFSTARRPIGIFEIEESESFCVPRENELHIYNMPIKIPNSLEYKIPIELSMFLKTIQKVINYEHFIKPNTVVGDYAYLSIDQSWILPGNSQRRPGAHTDDMQGPRYPKKLFPNQTYIVSNSLPTKTYPQSFELSSYDPDVYDLLPLIQKQADESIAWSMPALVVCLYDSYTIHTADVNTTSEKIWRTLFRLEFTQKIGDEISNTRNPLLKEHLDTWTYQSREKPNLRSPF